MKHRSMTEDIIDKAARIIAGDVILPDCHRHDRSQCMLIDDPRTIADKLADAGLLADATAADRIATFRDRCESVYRGAYGEGLRDAYDHAETIIRNARSQERNEAQDTLDRGSAVITDTDDLRDKLTEALVQYQARFMTHPPLEGLRRDFELAARPYVDALMPVVREALADAWDGGVEYAAVRTPMDLKANPWRDEPTKGGNK